MTAASTAVIPALPQAMGGAGLVKLLTIVYALFPVGVQGLAGSLNLLRIAGSAGSFKARAILARLFAIAFELLAHGRKFSVHFFAVGAGLHPPLLKTGTGLLQALPVQRQGSCISRSFVLL